jgi:hypothetical protein
MYPPPHMPHTSRHTHQPTACLPLRTRPRNAPGERPQASAPQGVCVGVHVCVCACVCLCVCMYMFTHFCVCVCICSHTHPHPHTPNTRQAFVLRRLQFFGPLIASALAAIGISSQQKKSPQTRKKKRRLTLFGPLISVSTGGDRHSSQKKKVL